MSLIDSYKNFDPYTYNLYLKHDRSQKMLKSMSERLKKHELLDKPNTKQIEGALDIVKKKAPKKTTPALSNLHHFLLTNHHSLRFLSEKELGRILKEEFLKQKPEKVETDVDDSIRALRQFYMQRVSPEPTSPSLDMLDLWQIGQ